MKKTDSQWSVPVAVEDIPDTGLHREIEAPAAVRAAVAALAQLRGLAAAIGRIRSDPAGCRSSCHGPG